MYARVCARLGVGGWSCGGVIVWGCGGAYIGRIKKKYISSAATLKKYVYLQHENTTPANSFCVNNTTQSNSPTTQTKF